MFAACLTTYCKRIYNTLSSKVLCKDKAKKINSVFFVAQVERNFTKKTEKKKKKQRKLLLPWSAQSPSFFGEIGDFAL